MLKQAFHYLVLAVPLVASLIYISKEAASYFRSAKDPWQTVRIVGGVLNFFIVLAALFFIGAQQFGAAMPFVWVSFLILSILVATDIKTTTTDIVFLIWHATGAVLVSSIYVSQTMYNPQDSLTEMQSEMREQQEHIKKRLEVLLNQPLPESAIKED